MLCLVTFSCLCSFNYTFHGWTETTLRNLASLQQFIDKLKRNTKFENQ